MGTSWFSGEVVLTRNKTLPFGTPDEVKTEVLERLRIFAPGGGYVFNAIHNIQQPTPIENILAMYEAVEIYNQEISQ